MKFSSRKTYVLIWLSNQTRPKRAPCGQRLRGRMQAPRRRRLGILGERLSRQGNRAHARQLSRLSSAVAAHLGRGQRRRLLGPAAASPPPAARPAIPEVPLVRSYPAAVGTVTLAPVQFFSTDLAPRFIMREIAMPHCPEMCGRMCGETAGVCGGGWAFAARQSIFCRPADLVRFHLSSLRISSSFCSRIMDLDKILRISAANYLSKSDTRELIRFFFGFLVQLPHFLRSWHLFLPLQRMKIG